jgi:hypothetical protein
MCRYLVLDETDKMTEIGLVTSIFGPHTLVVQGLMYRYLVVDETDQMIERVEGLMGTSTQSEFSHLLQQESGQSHRANNRFIEYFSFSNFCFSFCKFLNHVNSDDTTGKIHIFTSLRELSILG